jgi:hypothetical protein
MEVTDADMSTKSTMKESLPEDEKNIQNDEEKTENIIFDLQSTLYAGKRIKLKEDKISNKTIKII